MSVQSLLDAALEMAELAATLMLSSAEESSPRRKSDGTLVTNLDHAVDRLVRDEIRRRFPAHHILSEESQTVYDPAASYTWIVDPLDGTTNYARGLSIWGVSLVLVQGGTPSVGVLAFPLLREVFAAADGLGSTRNGHPIQTSPLTTPDDTQLINTCTRTAGAYIVRTPLKVRSLGSAAYHIAKVADGTALAAIEAAPKIWDLAAALLILDEAGGVYTPLDDQPKTFPLAPERHDFLSHAMPMLAAANGSVLAAVRQGILGRYN